MAGESTDFSPAILSAHEPQERATLLRAIGGPRHGEFLRLPDGRVVLQVAWARPHKPWTDLHETREYFISTYRAMTFSRRDERIEVLVDDTLGERDVNLLLQHLGW